MMLMILCASGDGGSQNVRPVISMHLKPRAAHVTDTYNSPCRGFKKREVGNYFEMFLNQYASRVYAS